MMKCDPRAYAQCPDHCLCGLAAHAVFMEGSECDEFNQAVLNKAANVVEIPDKQLLRAVKLLIKQYEHSKQSDYVHNPIAHAFFHTWKLLDECGHGKKGRGK